MTTPEAQRLTLFLIIAALAAVVAYDVLAHQAWGPNATISRVLRRSFDRWPILYPVFWLAVGTFIGHIGLPTE